MAGGSSNIGSASVELRGDLAPLQRDLAQAKQAVSQTAQAAGKSFSEVLGASISRALGGRGGGYAIPGSGGGAGGGGGRNTVAMGYADAPMGGGGGASADSGGFGYLAFASRIGAIGAGAYYAGRALFAGANQVYRGAGARLAGFNIDSVTDADAAKRVAEYERLQRDANTGAQEALYDYTEGSGAFGGVLGGAIAKNKAEEAAAYSSRAQAARRQLITQARRRAANQLAAEVIGLGSSELISGGNVSLQSTFIDVAGDAIRLRLGEEQKSITTATLSNIEEMARTSRAQSFQ